MSKTTLPSTNVLWHCCRQLWRPSLLARSDRSLPFFETPEGNCDLVVEDCLLWYQNSRTEEQRTLTVRHMTRRSDCWSGGP